MADAAHRDPHAFGTNGESLVQGLPPVVGSTGGSTWFGNGGHISQDQVEFGVPALEGFSLLFDAQADSDREQVVCGGADDAGRIVLLLNERGIPGMLSLSISTPEGATFECRAQLSPSRARRLLVAVAPRAHKAAVYELQPWADSPGSPLSCNVRSSGTLRRIGPLPGQFTIAGLRDHGRLASHFTGRLAEVALFQRVLSPERSLALAAASDNPSALTLSNVRTPSAELIDRFRRDLGRLRAWSRQPTMSADDVDDAALLVYRWFLDRHPVLLDLCRALGVQLWLAGASDREIRYVDAVFQDVPMIHVRGPVADPFGFAWRSLDEWRSERVFHTRGTPVSIEQFAKFIRNKLGAGHLDEQERTRWQRDLLEVSANLTIAGSSAFAFQMHALMDGLLRSIAAMRLETVLG
jgi:hypothetical protein